MTAFDEMVSELTSRGFRRDVAEAQVRLQRPELSPESIEKAELDEEALEKAIEAEGDRIMLALGFEVVRLSQARRSKVAPGLPDRRYYRRPRKTGAYFLPKEWSTKTSTADAAGQEVVFTDGGIKIWWEAKSETGRQRPDQKLFQEMVEACGETYVLGTHKDLLVWLEANRIVQVEQDGSITPLSGVGA